MSMIDNFLFDLKMASKASEARFASWAYDAIAWYIGSGRAPEDFLKAIVKADKAKLIDVIANAPDKSTEGMVNKCFHYLKLRRYKI